MKIKKIEVKNFKALSEQTAEFNGCSAIVTAGNNEGKTSFLRGLIDRMRGRKPSVILKEGEEKGYNYIELTDGSRFEWNFGKTERFSFITKEGVKQTEGVLSGIGKRYFGTKFDIDKFLNSGGQAQTKELQRLIGIDCTEIDVQYKEAYEVRTVANRKLTDLRGAPVNCPEKVEQPNIEGLKAKKTGTKKLADDSVRGNHLKNNDLRKDYEDRKELLRIEIQAFNSLQKKRETAKEIHVSTYDNLCEFRNGLFGECVDFLKGLDIINNLQAPEELRSYANEANKIKDPGYLNEIPDYSEVDKIDLELEKAYEDQQLYSSYKNSLENFNTWVAAGKAAKENQEICDDKVKAIESEKRKMIEEANLPKEFEIKDDGVYYNGFLLNDNQISSSAKYIAALKLGSMVLGEIKTMHFDASFLDKNSLNKVQQWANENDYQLLIERPKFDGGKIEYQII